MPKEIWKLGKFHKGINSHTDPKDISSEEWVELDDVDISKVGVAKPIGQPETNLTVNLSSDGKQYAMRYEKLVPILVKAIQELEARIAILEGE